MARKVGAHFRAMSIVVKRSPISATAEHLSNTVFVRYSNIVFFAFFACVRNFLFYGICITWCNKNSNEHSKCSNGLLTIIKTL